MCECTIYNSNLVVKTLNKKQSSISVVRLTLICLSSSNKFVPQVSVIGRVTKQPHVQGNIHLNQLVLFV